MSFVTLKTFDNFMHAHLLKTKLESEGIICFLNDELTTSYNPIWAIAIGGIKLKVRTEDAQSALQIIETINNTPLTNEEDDLIFCPKCHSSKIKNGYTSNFKTLRGILSLVLTLITTSYPIYTDPIYKCHSCGHEFLSE